LKRVLLILGTRPEAIKLAPVIHKLKEYPDIFSTAVCSTGQHIEMLYQVIKDFDLQIDYDLKLMKKNQTLSELTGTLVTKLSEILKNYSPDIILVQGDTTTAFIGALIGHYFKIEIGHVEAGLRTNNKFAPFPEEMNRRLVGVLADYHFAPTIKARNELLKEGTDESRIIVTGNTVIDALFYILEKSKNSKILNYQFKPIFSNGKKIVLITGHRRENFGKGFLNICQAIRYLANKYQNVNFVYPVHLNPNVQKPVYEFLQGLNNVYLLTPLEYIPFVYLMNKSHLILTDSGGIQEEAPSLGKPVLIMREVTERPEAVEAGTAKLVGTDPKKFVDEVSKLLTDKTAWESMSRIKNPFGDGKAASRVVEYLMRI